MLARLGANFVLLAVGLGMAFFGVGLLGVALAICLTTQFGPAGAYAIAGGILLLPPLFWALARMAFPPAKPKPAPASGIVAALIAAVAKETPWIAVIGAGLGGLTEMFLNRNKRRK